jgi:DHA2 family methylenomycin A resistance protein-like MFS transporter
MKKNFLPLLVLCSGFFMVIVDVMIVNIALPNIASALHANITDLQWVIDGYALTFACFLLFAGNVGDRLGSKTVFIGGLIFFVAMSLGCGLATDIQFLLICRLLQGFAAALLMPTSLSLIYTNYDTTEERAHAIGIWGMVVGVGAALAPVLGGILTEYLGWRSIFLVNVPIGLLAILGTFKCIKNTLPNTSISFDIKGQVMAILCIASLAFALIEVGRLGWLNIWVMSSFIMFVVSLYCFIWFQHHSKNPMLPLYFFKSPIFSSSLLLGLCLNLFVYGILFIFPLYFQQVKHYSTLLTSLAILPLTAFTFVGSYIAGKLTSRFGPRLPTLIGFGLSLLGFLWLMVFFHHDAGYPFLLIAFILWSAGSLAMPAITFAVMHSVPSQKTGLASAAFHTARQIGSLIGVAIFGTIITLLPPFMRGIYVDFVVGAMVCLIAFCAAFVWMRAV